MNDQPTVVVVGAGLAGLAAARKLSEAGLNPLVIDKGRAVGGRMATKRHEGARYDHGAQRFRAQSAEFRSAVDQWRASGVVATWFEEERISRGERQTLQRLIGSNGMRGIPEHLAQGLDVRLATQVSTVRPDDGGVVALTASGPVPGAAAIVTAPLPQTLAMVDLAANPDLFEELSSIRYNACLAVMAQVRDTRKLASGRLQPDSHSIGWIADNQHKGVSSLPAVTIHSTPRFAATHLESDRDDWVPLLVTDAERLLATEVIPPALGHRWRYAEPQTTLGTGFAVVADDVPIVLAGEAFVSARVEGAFLSGLAAANAVVNRLA